MTATGKRSYVPKVRGCYECSQRRINCDRRQPSCGKCAAKGIECSGFGIRYRFSNDVVSKGRTCGKRESRSHPSATSSTKGGRLGPCPPTTDIDIDQDLDQDMIDGYPNIEQWSLSLEQQSDEWKFDDEYADYNTASTHQLMSAATTPSDLGRAIEHATYTCRVAPAALNSWQRYLISYFSDKIAPELVVIDDQTNGWRHLILPMAHLNEIVRDAVMSASAFHFSHNLHDSYCKPTAIYQSAIQRLRQRQNLEAYDTLEQQSVLLALLVLLAAFMVNGYADFRAVFNLLESALKAIGGEDALTGELGLFLRKQIRKLRGYGSPFLSQVKAVAILSLTSEAKPSVSGGWDCFRSYYNMYPDLSKNMCILYDLHEMACDIYVRRSLAGATGTDMTETVERYKNTMELFPPGAMGEHILVWPTFLAAAASTKAEHQEYFADKLLMHYKRNGFANIIIALDHLRQLWASKDVSDWTEYLQQLEVFIV